MSSASTKTMFGRSAAVATLRAEMIEKSSNEKWRLFTFETPGPETAALRQSCQSPDHSKPGFRPAWTERHALYVGTYFEMGRLNGFNHPAVGKSGVQICLRNAPGTFVARFGIAKAFQQKAATGLQHRCQAGNVALAVFVRKNMEQTAVDHGIELLWKRIKM